MAVDDELPIRTLFVLTHLGAEHRRTAQGREAAVYERAELSRGRGRCPVPCGRVKIGAARVISNLEAAMQVAGDAVDKTVAEIDPHRKSRFEKPFIPGGSAEVEDLLPC